jgi:DNA polymerase-3 subunit alpha
MGTFVHLNGHSEYSSDSNAQINQIVAAAAANGQRALALTDTNLVGAPHFREEAQRHGIKPIIGLDVRLVDDRRVSEPGSIHHLTLLAQNRTGWHNLVALYNAAAVPERRQSIVDYDLLGLYAEGLVVLTGGREGPIVSYLHEGKPETARENLTRLERAMGAWRVFLEASNPADAALLSAAFESPYMPVVATGQYRQVGESDSEGRKAIMNILAGRKGWGSRGPAMWLRTEAEMRELAADSLSWQNAIATAGKIADAIDYDVIPERGRNTPLFPVPEGFPNPEEYLRHLAFRGAASRFDEIPFEVIERLNGELEIIAAKEGAADTVLVAHDVIKWCADNGIFTAPRGNSSGSMVLYCLEMTDLNPLSYGLLFERFLRPERSDLPALDFDVQASRKQDVHDYLGHRWPARMARAAAHAVVKAETWIRRGLISEEQADLVEGRFLSRHIHACAVVVAPRELTDQLPILPDWRPGHDHELPVTNWDANTLRDEGYLVLHLLASSNLDLIAQTADKAREDRSAHVHLGRLLPDGDADLYASSTPAAWDLIATGDTDGVFQLGAQDAVTAARAARPRNLTDMAVLIALYGKEDG